MKKSMGVLSRVILLIGIMIILSSCGDAAAPEATLDFTVFVTNAALTIEAQSSEPQGTEEAPAANAGAVLSTAVPAAEGMPQSGLEVISRPAEEIVRPQTEPTAEIVIAQPAAAPTEVPTATSASVVISLPAIGAPETGGDEAAYEGQTPEDGTHMKAGTDFDIIWYLKNTGTTTWTKDYSLRYFSNTDFSKSGKERWRLSKPVAPGETGALTMDAIAPDKPGTYTMAVVLGNDADENFMIVDLTIIVD